MALHLLAAYESDDEELFDVNTVQFDCPNIPQVEAPQNVIEQDNICKEVRHVVNSLVNRIVKQNPKLNATIVDNFDTHRGSIEIDHFNTDVSDDSDSDLSSWYQDDDVNDDELFDIEEFNENGRPGQIHKCVTKGELTLEDLPPIERLQISVPINELTQIGIVHKILSPLVIIQSFKNQPILDLDTVLFSRDGTSLGRIFDVIGPVRQPNYVLRFNSLNEIKDECKLTVDSAIYFAETKATLVGNDCDQPEPITKYVFVQQLESEKGSDASWKDNNEPPAEELDYSDDEEERKNKWRLQAKSRRK